MVVHTQGADVDESGQGAHESQLKGKGRRLTHQHTKAEPLSRARIHGTVTPGPEVGLSMTLFNSPLIKVKCRFYNK